MQRSGERMRLPKGYRAPPMVMTAGYPEKSFYAALTLPPLASPPHARRPVDWSGRLPSRTAFADWLHDSNPAERCDVTSLAETAA